MEENAGAVEVELSDDELDKINEIAPRGVASGARYPEQSIKSIEWQ